jgi:hypothetical protein
MKFHISCAAGQKNGQFNQKKTDKRRILQRRTISIEHRTSNTALELGLGRNKVSNKFGSGLSGLGK